MNTSSARRTGRERATANNCTQSLVEAAVDAAAVTLGEFAHEVHPHRAVAIASLLRRQVIQVHSLRLGAEARRETSQALYAFLVSPRAAEMWDEAAKAADSLRTLDAAERAAHEKVWTERASLIGKVHEGHDAFVKAIDAIIGDRA
jgi:hypothetical protein